MRLLITTQVVDKNDPILGFFHAWIIEFSKHFEHVFIICLREGTHTLPQNVTVYSLGKENGGGRVKYIFKFYYFFTKIFFSNRIDYIFFHMGEIFTILAAPFYLVRKIFKTKFYWWKTHGHINLLGRIALYFVDRVYTASKGSFPINTTKKYIVGHAIDTQRFSYTPRALDEKMKLLCVSRISRIKKLEKVLDVAQLLDNRDIPFEITFVGTIVDETYYGSLRMYVQSTVFSDHIRFVGSVTHHELAQYYADADVLIHPSETGSFDKVVLEAMASGTLPIALCNAYGPLLKTSNLCVQGNTAEAFAEIIERIWKHKAEYPSIALQLRDVVEKHHTLSTLTRRIFNTTT